MYPVRELIDAHGRLVRSLRRFAFPETARLVGGLLSLPQFHANTLRLEAFLHLACVCCVGRDPPSRNDLVRWLGKQMRDSPLTLMEDPVEDVFIGNVATVRGNFRVFRGIAENGDFSLEQLISVLTEPGVPPEVGTILERAFALLRLCEAVAQRMNYPRCREGGGSASAPLVMPPWRTIQQGAAAVTFSLNELRALGVTKALLEPFILTDAARERVKDETIFHSSLERHPLLLAGDSMVLHLPAAVIRAARRYVLEELDALGLLGLAASLLHARQTELLLNHVLSRLNIDPAALDLPPKPEGTWPLHDFVGTFDSGKYAHVVFLHENTRAFLIEGDDGVEDLAGKRGEALRTYLRLCADQLAARDDFSGGLTVITIGGVGRGIGLGLPKMPDEWGCFLVPLPDLLMLALSGEASALRIWRFWQYHRAARQYGARIHDASGILNRFAFWKAFGFRLFPRDMPFSQPRKMVAIGCDFVGEFRAQVRQTNDWHSVLGPTSDEWVVVARLSPQHLFQDTLSVPACVDVVAAVRKLLRGVVETATRHWWICVHGVPPQGKIRDTVYQIWECVLNWVERLAPIVEKHVTSQPDARVLIELDFGDMSAWSGDITDSMKLP